MDETGISPSPIFKILVDMRIVELFHTVNLHDWPPCQNLSSYIVICIWVLHHLFLY